MEEEKKELSFKLLCVIVAQNDGEQIADTLRGSGAVFNFICRGKGTANSQFLDLLGLDSDKEAVLSVIETHKAKEIVNKLYDAYRAPGIAFTVRLKALGGMRTLKLFQGLKSREVQNGTGK